MKLYSITVLLIMFSIIGKAQSTLTGYVFELDENGKKQGLAAATIGWVGTSIYALTNGDGWFTIKKPKLDKYELVVRYISYSNDTIHYTSTDDSVEIQLKINKQLNEVIITGVTKGSYISRINPMLTNMITSEELTKAACCNLSESFETNPSIDVSYSDAISGAKQIQLLGLSGNYIQLLQQNLPNIRGLALLYGLEYTPGPWLESIQVSKGAASVTNGFESITGQINTELKKPDGREKFYFNIFENTIGNTEVNTNFAHKFNSKLSTILFAHVQNNDHAIDMNKDGFLDHPKMKSFNVLNEWKLHDTNGFITHANINVMRENRQSGQANFDIHADRDSAHPYGIGLNTIHYQGNLKQGYMFKGQPYKSVAFIGNATYHSMDAFYGLNNYYGEQKTVFANLIYQSIINSTNHKFTTGASFMYDKFHEKLNDSLFAREEIVPGAYFQYTYSNLDKLSFITGLRADYHNQFGLFFTPRLHVKYSINKQNIIRFSAGKGYRTSNIIAENTSILASSRKIVVLNNPEQERAWNYGISYSKYIEVIGKEMNINLEVFRTDFQNQVIADMDSNHEYVYIYNLDGHSYANVLQAEIRYELIKHLDFVGAFRLNDVHYTLNNKSVEKPLVNKYKALFTFTYKTGNKRWQVDFTTQLNGYSRLPETSMLPAIYHKPTHSPVYPMLLGQISRKIKRWDFYIGVENLTNFTQKDPIIAADDPFGKYFDASMVWGPLLGRKFYGGLRYKI